MRAVWRDDGRRRESPAAAPRGRLAAPGLVRPGVRMLARFFDNPPACRKRRCARQPALPAARRARGPHLLRRTARTASGGALRVHTGPYASMGAAHRWRFGAWLAQSSREPANAPAVEEYLNSPRDTAPADLVTPIHLPLRSR